MAQPDAAPPGPAAPAYQPDYARQAEHLCRLGAEIRDIAAALAVDEATIGDWLDAHAAFAQAVARGRAQADGVVTTALFKRATGFDLEMVKWLREDGKMVAKSYVRHVPPDTKACMFWLQARRPDLWGRRRAAQAIPAVRGMPVTPDDEVAKAPMPARGAADDESLAPVQAAPDAPANVDRRDETPVAHHACPERHRGASDASCPGEDQAVRREAGTPGSAPSPAHHAGDPSNDGQGVICDQRPAPAPADAVPRAHARSGREQKWKRKQKRAETRRRRAAIAAATRPSHPLAA